LRIAYVITRADAVGGASVHVRDMARAMLARGHEAMVFIGGRGAVTERLAAAGVPYTPLASLRRPIDPWRDLRALGEISEALCAWGPDLVSTHTAKAGWLGRAACARLGIPAIYTPHGWQMDRRATGLRGRVYAQAERWAARWARAIVCVCEYERDLALKNRIARAEQLHTIHNAVDDVPLPLRAQPGAEPARIVAVARLEAPKDPETLLRAMAPLGDRPWELEWIGDGPMEPAVRRLAEHLGLASKVQFAGYRPDPAPALGAAQIFVLASRSEGFPRSILEAMRAGLPVIASEVGGVSEAVEHGVTGLLAAPGDAAGLTAAIGSLLENAALRERLGAAGRRAYESRFRLERMVDATAALYDRVLAGA
jgi:glycosyltransferase involved in cell wall biosynthesis